MKRVEPLHPTIDLDRLAEISERASAVIDRVRESMLAPESRKSPPRFTAAQLADLCGVDKNKISYTAKKGKLPPGNKHGQRLEWTLAETRQWVREFRSDFLRDPELAGAAVLAVANLKGGVGKTTTTMCLAQRLSLLGHNVLLIDLDAQASLTHLNGILPPEVSDDSTVLNLCAGEIDSLLSCVQETYWDGISLIPANNALFNIEFLMPARQRNEDGFEFWRVLENGLEECINKFDVILIDTPPSISYSTLMAISAAQGLILPCPPASLDVASLQQFFALTTEVLTGLYRSTNSSKSFSFINILINKPERETIATAVRQWMTASYSGMILPVEIPKTSIAGTASSVHGTAYDLDSSVNQKTLARAITAYDQLGNYVEQQVMAIWSADAESLERVS
jgi:chromosome partitioning protein